MQFIDNYYNVDAILVLYIYIYSISKLSKYLSAEFSVNIVHRSK